MEKTYITMLQEFCAQNKYQLPLYEELANDSSRGPTVFKFKVQIRLPERNYEGIGSGLNKKSAKQNAANELCDQLGLKSENFIPDTTFEEKNMCLSLINMNIITPEKTPVTMLQEFCAKNKIVPPIYEEFQVEGNPLHKLFKCKAILKNQVEEKFSIGTGLTKKRAKHDAAQHLLELLGQKYEWTAEIDQDSVSTLHHLCLSRQYCTPVYEEVEMTGPSHCPEFTTRCSVALLAREAKAPSKKWAKQKVAREIIQFIESSTNEDLERLQVFSNEPGLIIEQETLFDEVIYARYYQYKNNALKKPFKSEICNRHDFYISHLDPIHLSNARHEFISSKHKTLREKVEKTLEIVDFKYEVLQIPSFDEPMLSFEITNKPYDSYLVAFEKELWNQVTDYLIVMLNIETTLSDTLQILT